MAETLVRVLAARDIPAILRIQRSSREAAQWPEPAYREARIGENAWVAERNGEIAGFLVVRVAAAEMEILNFAVHSNLRRQGIGKCLLQTALLWASERGADRAFLEVRSANIAARKFYEAHGFFVFSARSNYYHDPDEDALILTRALGPA